MGTSRRVHNWWLQFLFIEKCVGVTTPQTLLFSVNSIPSLNRAIQRASEATLMFEGVASLTFFYWRIRFGHNISVRLTLTRDWLRSYITVMLPTITITDIEPGYWVWHFLQLSSLLWKMSFIVSIIYPCQSNFLIWNIVIDGKIIHQKIVLCVEHFEQWTNSTTR